MEIPDWKKNGSDSDEGQKACWKNKRSQLISQSDEIIEAAPGETTLPMITFKNATHWPWKQGCTLSFHNKMSKAENMVVEPVNVPIDFHVKGQTEYSMAVPIKVFENALPSDELHHIKLAFRGPNGNQFGQSINFQVKIKALSSQEKSAFEEVEEKVMLEKLHSTEHIEDAELYEEVKPTPPKVDPEVTFYKTALRLHEHFSTHATFEACCSVLR